MSGNEDDGAVENAPASDRPHEPDEPALPGEDNPGERLIEKYDPTIDGEATADSDPGPDLDDVDLPQDTARLFWYLVAVFNVALMGVAVGLMVIGFQGRWALGGQLTLAGTILFGYGLYRYRKHARGSSSRDDVDRNR